MSKLAHHTIFLTLTTISLLLQSPLLRHVHSLETISHDIELKSPLYKFWGGIKNSATIFPKIFPNLASIEILTGDGFSVGTTRLVRYAPGAVDGRTGEKITFAIERIELVDEEHTTFAYSLIAGEVMNIYKYLKISVHFVAHGEGTLAKWSAEYERASEDVDVDPHDLVDNVVHGYLGLDAYLLAAMETPTHSVA